MRQRTFSSITQGTTFTLALCGSVHPTVTAVKIMPLAEKVQEVDLYGRI